MDEVNADYRGGPHTLPARINDVDVAVMRTLMDTALATSDATLTPWRVVTVWTPGLDGGRGETRISYGDDADGPEGGGDPTPQEQLLEVANNCVVLGLRVRCALEGLQVRAVEVTTTGESGLRGLVYLPSLTAGFQSLETQVAVRGDGPRANLDEIAREVLATSPVLACLRQAVGVSARVSA